MNQVRNVKNITIEYYSTCSLVETSKRNNEYSHAKTDITNLLKSLQNKAVKERSIYYNGENLILTSITYNKTTKLWELVFFKSRTATVPFIINSDGNSREIILEKDEMISQAIPAYKSPSNLSG